MKKVSHDTKNNSVSKGILTKFTLPKILSKYIDLRIKFLSFF